jgi:DNA ligase (NAD+)
LLKVIDVKSVETKTGALSGKTFLITGALSAVRSVIEKKIEEAGGTMVSGVSKRLNYLVVGNDPGSKLDKAKKLGTKIITEAELNQMF